MAHEANGCNLRNLERLIAKKERSLSKRSELQAICQHENKTVFVTNQFYNFDII